jgi:nickel/cobalt transporter (NicO) family protein
VILAQATELDRFETYLVRLMDTEYGLLLAVGALIGAVGAGAAHALAPGHAKTITAAYLVSSQGRTKDALAVGGIVSAMHTGSVLLLGAVLYLATDGPFTPDRLVPWMSLGAGVLVLGIGLGLVVRHARRRRAASDHQHDHGLAALPDDISPLSLRGVVLIGLAGGLIPSPAAFLVLATAIFVDRLLFGVALVLAFSVGLALTIATIAILAVRGRDVLARRRTRHPLLERVAQAVPLGASLIVVLGGLYLTTVAARGLV